MISVLLIEDDQTLLGLTGDYLSRKGTITVHTATSASEAIKKISTRKYDAIVSDYQMPEMDGLELLKFLRSSGDMVPFIIFTGRSREHVVIEALNNGADFYLQKGGEPKSQFAELENMILQATSRKSAEDALRESIRRLSDIINFLPDATFAIDQVGKVIAWNRAIQELTGISAARMLGQDDSAYSFAFYNRIRPLLIDLIFVSDEEVMNWGYTSVKRKGNALIAECTNTVPGGDRVFWVIATPLYDEKGSVAGAIQSMRDITDLRKAEDSLHQSEIKFKGVFEHSPVAIAVFDGEGNLVEANQPCQELCGGSMAIRRGGNLFSSHLLPERRREALIRGETVRFDLAPGISPEPDGLTIRCCKVLDVLVTPLFALTGTKPSGFLMQFRESQGNF